MIETNNSWTETHAGPGLLNAWVRSLLAGDLVIVERDDGLFGAARRDVAGVVVVECDGFQTFGQAAEWVHQTLDTA